jgi:hypothetical protein
VRVEGETECVIPGGNMEINGITIQTTPIETVIADGIEISLLSAGDGTEIILHKIKQGYRWALTSQEGWTAYEGIILLRGRMLIRTDKDEIPLQPGSSVSATPILEDTVFYAKTDAEFLYVTSQPVFTSTVGLVRT